MRGCYHWSYGILRAAGVTSSLRIEEPMLASLMSPLIGHRARAMIVGRLIRASSVSSDGSQRHSSRGSRSWRYVEHRWHLLRSLTACSALDSRTLQADLLAFEGRGSGTISFCTTRRTLWTPDRVRDFSIFLPRHSRPEARWSAFRCSVPKSAGPREKIGVPENALLYLYVECAPPIAVGRPRARPRIGHMPLLYGGRVLRPTQSSCPE